MSIGTDLTLLLYAGLYPEEERQLKAYDSEFAGIFKPWGIYPRLIWTAATSGGIRTLQLMMAATDGPRVIVEFAARDISDSVIVQALQNTTRSVLQSA